MKKASEEEHMVLIILAPRVLAGNRGPLKLDAWGRVYQVNREITGMVPCPRIGNIGTAPPLPLPLPSLMGQRESVPACQKPDPESSWTRAVDKGCGFQWRETVTLPGKETGVDTFMFLP